MKEGKQEEIKKKEEKRICKELQEMEVMKRVTASVLDDVIEVRVISVTVLHLRVSHHHFLGSNFNITTLLQRNCCYVL